MVTSNGPGIARLAGIATTNSSINNHEPIGPYPAFDPSPHPVIFLYLMSTV